MARIPRPRLLGLVGAFATAGALMSAAPAAHAATEDVYVSTHGSDHAPGTAGRPVRTLERARDLVRSRHPAGDLTVHIASGVYRLSSPLDLGAQDSGGGGHRMIWQGLAAP